MNAPLLNNRRVRRKPERVALRDFAHLLDRRQYRFAVRTVRLELAAGLNDQGSVHSVSRPEQDDPRAEKADGHAEDVPPGRDTAFNDPQPAQRGGSVT